RRKILLACATILSGLPRDYPIRSGGQVEICARRRGLVFVQCRGELVAYGGEVGTQCLQFVGCEADGRFGIVSRTVTVAKTVARPADGEPFFVQKLTYATDQQHFVMLIIPAVAPTLERLELRELLFPVTQHVRLDAASLADC